MPGLSILFEDNSLLVINKHAGTMVEKDKFGNQSIEGEVEDYFRQKRVSQNTIIGIVHRLDRPVSGVLLVAKKISILRELNKQFEEGRIDKVYYAIVENKPAKPEAHLQNYLRKDIVNKKAIIYKNKKENTVKCELFYKLVREEKNGFLLEVHPLTGKYHQIRAQLSFMGYPVIGDAMYGATKKYKADSIYLHAYSLEFFHPVEKKKIKIDAPLPADWRVMQL